MKLIFHSPIFFPMKRFLLYFLMFKASSLFALYDLSLGTGYRHDTMVYRETDDTGLFLRSFRDREAHSLVEYAQLNSYWGRVSFQFYGEYGFLLSGKRAIAISGGETSSDLFPSFNADLGYSFDAAGKVGYLLLLYHRQAFQMLLIPKVGYRYDLFVIRNKTVEKVDSVTFSTPDFPSIVNIFSPQKASNQWYGPLIEGTLRLENPRLWHIDFTYQRVFPRFIRKEHLFLNTIDLIPPATLTERNLATDIRSSSSSVTLDHASTDLAGLVAQSCIAGLQGHWFRMKTDGSTQLKTRNFFFSAGTVTDQTDREARKFKQKWISYSLLFYVGYVW